MILVIGSRGAGKEDFVKSLGYSDDQIQNHLEEIVFADPDCTERIFDDLLKKEVVICDEVGSGVIPTLREERVGREAAGRLCILLAKEADAVVRVVCGIPQVIKGSL